MNKPPLRSPLHETWLSWFAPCVILALIGLIYGQVLGHGFFNFDDPVYITDNPQVLRGLGAESFSWAWSTCLTGMWHPLTWLSLMANVSAFGQGALGFHAVNLLLHSCSALLLFYLLKNATGSYLRSLLVALLFALHPVNVETVAWASQRKSTLSTLLCLLALQAWLQYLQRGYRRSYLAALLCLALGLLAKPMLVSVPLLFLLLEYWPLEARKIPWRRRLLELLPFIVLSGISAWICVFPFGPSDVLSDGVRLRIADLMNVPLNIVSYLGKLAWPTELAIFYPRRADWSLLSFTLCSAGLGGALLLFWRSRNKVCLMGSLWFALCLAPVSGIISFGNHSMADRYLYLPAIGLFIAVIWSIPAKSSYQSLAALIVLFFGLLSFSQTRLWSHPSLLWLHASRITAESPVQLLNLGAALMEQGRMEETRQCMLRALALDPKEHRVWMNLGLINDRQGRKQEALRCLREAAKLAPTNAAVHNQLGSVLQDLGQSPEAEHEFNEALRLRPDYAECWLNMGVLRAGQGKLSAAIEAFEHALRIQPKLQAAISNLALARAQLASKPEQN